GVGLYFQYARRLDPGRVLARLDRIDSGYVLTALAEFDAATGRELRRLTLPQPVLQDAGLARLPNGHYLLWGKDVAEPRTGRLVEINAAGRPVWQYSLPDVRQAQRLRNGNTWALAS